MPVKKNSQKKWSHAWLEIDGIVIDITADQFNGRINGMDRIDSIIVDFKNGFYDLFDLAPNTGNIQGDLTEARSKKIYETILNYM